MRAIVEVGEDRPVDCARVYSSHKAEPLESHSILLLTSGYRPLEVTTTGLARTELQRLEEGKVAALVYCASPGAEGPPAALVHAAKQACFPFFEMDTTESAREIEQRINLEVQHHELESLRTAASILRSLLDAAASRDPLSSVVERLAAIARGAAFVYDLSGRVAHSAGVGPARLIWDEHTSVLSADGLLHIGRWNAVTRRIAHGPDIFLLAMASQEPRHLATVAEPALAASAQLFRTISGINSAAWTNQQHYGQSLLSLLRNGVPPSREPRLMDQLSPYGFHHGNTFRFAVMSSVDPTARRQHGLLSLGLDLGLGLVLAEHYDHGTRPLLHALVTEAPPFTPWIEEAGRSHVVGVSEPFHSLTDVPAAHQEAQTAHLIADQRKGADRGHVISMDQVGLSTWLKARHAGPQVAARMAREIAALQGNPQILETLVTWFRHRMDTRSTARAMFVHPNSIRYRLRRCEELLGRSLQDPETLTDIYLALQDEVLRSGES